MPEPARKADKAAMNKAEWQRLLAEQGYIAEGSLAAALAIYQQLRRPLLLEGDAGVGKTQIGRTLADIFNCKLIRLQCYEGLDVNTTVYEWNYRRQLLGIQLQKQHDPHTEDTLFSDRFLLKRPLLQAISETAPPVLLIDEIDRADEEFEAFLLEMLADYQISIPELGTIKAQAEPYVILTSNATRELGDALRRRCLYYYLEYPSFDKELQIIHQRLPAISETLARQLVSFVQDLRKQDLHKIPGIAETLDWASALMKLGVSSLDADPETLADSLICLLKTRADLSWLAEAELQRRVARAL